MTSVLVLSEGRSQGANIAPSAGTSSFVCCLISGSKQPAAADSSHQIGTEQSPARWRQQAGFPGFPNVYPLNNLNCFF